MNQKSHMLCNVMLRLQYLTKLNYTLLSLENSVRYSYLCLPPCGLLLHLQRYITTDILCLILDYNRNKRIKLSILD